VTKASASLRLLIREDCHLCTDMERALDIHCQRAGLAWQREDIDRNPQLVQQYGLDVPVLLKGERLLMAHFFDAVLWQAFVQEQQRSKA